MAPVYDYRHVELDKIGRGKRVLKPPGGSSSDIFGVQSPTQESLPQTPRKVKNYQQSTIFTPSDDEPSTPSSGASTPTRRRPSDNSQERLFGNDDYQTPRRIIDRMKSTIFTETDSPAPTPSPASKTFVSRNPITGEMYQVSPSKMNGHGQHNGTNGHGHNGYSNGSVSPTSPNGRCYQPPGGRSSGIF